MGSHGAGPWSMICLSHGSSRTFPRERDMKRNVCSLVLISILITADARGGGYTFTTIAIPNASQTQAFGINDANQVVGTYASDLSYGFLRSANGSSYTNINGPTGAGNDGAGGINNLGQIVGSYNLRDA